MTPPTIVTARLRLDGHARADHHALAALWADPATVRHIGAPSTPAESWSRLRRDAGLRPLLG